MAGFPAIARPCPLRFRSPPEPGRDWCGFCEQRVHNLDRMGEGERAALLARGGSICVAYSVQRAATAALAGAGVAVALTAAEPASADPLEITVTAKPRREFIQGGLAHVSASPLPGAAFSVGGTMAVEATFLTPDLATLGREIADFTAGPQATTRKAR